MNGFLMAAAGAVLVTVVAVKPLAAALTVRLLGRPMSVAVPVGAAFSQVGEFSFILGTLALNLGILGEPGWNALIAASIISIALNPAVYAAARRFRPAVAGEAPQADRFKDPGHCILIGYGPVGATLHGILSAAGTRVSVIELNLDTVRRLRAKLSSG